MTGATLVESRSARDYFLKDVIVYICLLNPSMFQPTGPSPLVSRPALRHGTSNSLFQVAVYLPSRDRMLWGHSPVYREGYLTHKNPPPFRTSVGPWA